MNPRHPSIPPRLSNKGKKSKNYFLFSMLLQAQCGFVFKIKNRISCFYLSLNYRSRLTRHFGKNLVQPINPVSESSKAGPRPSLFSSKYSRKYGSSAN